MSRGTPFHALNLQMGRPLKPRAGAFLLFLLLALGGQAWGPSPASALSLEDEKAMGKEFLAEVQKHFTFLDDPFPRQYLQRLGDYLAQKGQVRDFPLRFFIIKDGTLNAFAGPAGYLFVFSGLIDAFQDADQLAAVVAHEIGHVSARHLSQRLEQSKRIGMATMAAILAGALIGGELATAVMAGATAAGLQAQLHYSRNDERQADQLSFQVLKPAGFDPSAMLGALDILQKNSYLGTDKVPAYLLTHPTGPERIANLQSLLSTYRPQEPPQEVLRFRALFPYFQTAVRAASMEPQQARERFGRDLQKDPHSSVALYGLGLMDMEGSDYPKAVSRLSQALEKAPGNVPILTSLGKAYMMNGQTQEAIKALEQALSEDRNDAGALLNLGLVYENLGQYPKAATYFERLVYQAELPQTEALYHLGLCYGRIKRLALAHYYFGLYQRELGNRQKALFHLKKAADLAAGDTMLRQRIREVQQGLK